MMVACELKLEELLKEVLVPQGSPISLKDVINYVKAREPEIDEREVLKALSRSSEIYLFGDKVYFLDE